MENTSHTVILVVSLQTRSSLAQPRQGLGSRLILHQRSWGDPRGDAGVGGSAPRCCPEMMCVVVLDPVALSQCLLTPGGTWLWKKLQSSDMCI